MQRPPGFAIALLAAATVSCAAPKPSDQEVIRAYRLFGWGRCAAVRAQAQEMDFSGDGAKREPFFRLMEGYCAEREGDNAGAKQLYSSVVATAPQTAQAFEAALRLRELERLEKTGMTREELKSQAREAAKTARYQHGVRPINRIDPKYPSAIVAAGLKGWVVVDFEISKEGSVVDPVVLDSDPPFVFDGAALAAMRHWVYEPSNNSEPIRATVRLNFDIQHGYR